MSRQKQKGTTWETGVVEGAKSDGLPEARRIPLHGIKDYGDVYLCDIDGKPLIVECKSHKSYDLPGWLRQSDNEAENAGTPWGVVIFKLNGIGIANIDRHPVVMRFGVFKKLLRYVKKLEADNRALRAQVHALKERRFMA